MTRKQEVQISVVSATFLWALLMAVITADWFTVLSAVLLSLFPICVVIWAAWRKAFTPLGIGLLTGVTLFILARIFTVKVIVFFALLGFGTVDFLIKQVPSINILQAMAAIMIPVTYAAYVTLLWKRRWEFIPLIVLHFLVSSIIASASFT